MVSILIFIIYLAFISLGLPDGLLGAAWPSMYNDIEVPVSGAGIISMIIALGTIVSALFSDRLTMKLGAGKITAVSVAMTCISLFGFSVSSSFTAIILWSVPYGLGAGSVDAALNNYVAVNYSSRHMSWLHCMWGIGASVGPYLMGYAISSSEGWTGGYRHVGFIQIILSAVLFLSLPLWKQRKNISSENKSENEASHRITDILKIKGVIPVLAAFFCYCALEGTAGLWAASYLQLVKETDKATAASMASLFYIGITAGRAINGFLTIKFSDTKLIRAGQIIILAGALVIMLPFSSLVSFAGIVIVGLGCAPIYPCIIHSTPERFGEEKSQSIIGIQMASAYIGTMTMPALFGFIGENTTMKLWPYFLMLFLIIMAVMHEKLVRSTERK